MKIFRTILFFTVFALFAAGCEQELDEITPVKPGVDLEAPTVTINVPAQGKIVRVMEGENKFTLTATAEDDIEIKSVKFFLNEAEIANVTSFKDYRIAVINQVVEGLADGDHVLTVTVEDMKGQTDSKTRNFRKVTATPYTPLEGEIMYFPFEGDLLEAISGNSGTKTGSPTFVTGKVGDAYKGASGAYFTYPAADLSGSTEFSVAFWYKLNPLPVRGGLISISRPETESQDNRNSGFRMGRENAGDNQNIFANIGINPDDPAGEVWMNPFYVATPGTDWIHIAFSITSTMATAYINGEVVLETELDSPISWEGVNNITIASGEPNWTYWDHFSDESLFDEMHFFNRAITAEEVNTLYTAGEE